jgi:hypothetical protein
MDERRREASRDIQLAKLDRAIEAARHILRLNRGLLGSPRMRAAAAEQVIDGEEELAILQEQRRLVAKLYPTPEELRAIASNLRAMARLAARERARRQRAVSGLRMG